MAIEREDEKIRAALFQTKVRCLDCDCKGVLRLKGKKLYLLPIEVLTTRSMRTQKNDIRKLKKKKTWKKRVTAKMSLAKHGNATDPQQYSYLSLGTLFWGTIILLANVASLEKSRGVTTFLTSTCNRNYKECVKIAEMDICGHFMKQCYDTEEFILPEPISKVKKPKSEPVVFSEEENKVSLRRCQKKTFYDQNICRHLCSNTLVLESMRTKPISPCESICFELTRSCGAGEVCPTQKYCQNGCPCPFYQCEKFQSRQKFIPVFDLKSIYTSFILEVVGNQSNADLGLITARWNKREKEEPKVPKFIFSDFNENEKNIDLYESFIPYSTGATFLDGEHYLVDAVGNLMKVKENGDLPILIPNSRKRIGFFVFHFGSSISTHHIEIRFEEKGATIFPVVAICSPSSKSDKCYYYAPDYNLNRFEEAHGYIASNHFNAKVSSISFKGVFYLMSVKMGDYYIKLSQTVALNRIRQSEELEKGWRKNEIQLPAELRDLDPVHVVPLNDMGRLLLIVVTRSVILSNTLYSLLLEAEGKFLTLGSEWIGSLVKYEQESICYSKLFADDHHYTDQIAVNNDEFEYFGNGFINEERIFVQSYVFDAAFEIEFNFEQVEVEFVQQKSQKKIHVTSNPFFAFHDDVFPSFSKNAVRQSRFPASSLYHKTIVPDEFFTSLKELKHISTVELELNGKKKFQLEIDVGTGFFKETKILQFNFFDERTLLRLRLSKNGSFWIESDFFDKFFIQQSKKQLDFAFCFDSKRSFVEVFQANEEEAHSKVKITGLENAENRKFRIFKLEQETKIKNFILKSRFDSQINVILPDHNDILKHYALKPDGSKNEEIFVKSPFDYSGHLSQYVHASRHALIKGRLHIFGGVFDNKKISRLDGCQFTELAFRLSYNYDTGHSALSMEEGSKAIICFPYSDRGRIYCQSFDDLKVENKEETNIEHEYGELALYNGRLIAIGGIEAEGAVEELSENGWTVSNHLTHPLSIVYFSAIELPSGSLLTIGGWDVKRRSSERLLNEIWELKNDKWSEVGEKLSKAVFMSSSIILKSSIFVFPGRLYEDDSPIHKFDLDSDGKIIQTQVMNSRAQVLFPIVFLTPVNHCTNDLI